MSRRDLSLLFILAAMWGGSFLFIRVSAPVLGPVVLGEVRVGLAAAALLLYAGFSRHRPALRTRWKSYLMLGLLNAAIPFVLIATAELHLTAALAAILNATTPLFGAVVAAVWLGEAFTRAKGMGLVLGVSGVAVLVGWSPLRFDVSTVVAIGASLLAALSYGVGGAYARRAFKGAQPLDLAIGQQAAATLLLFPLAVPSAVGHTLSISISPVVAFSVVMLSLLCTAVAYILYFALIASVGSTKTLSVTLLAPLFGVLWGALFLRETVSLSTVLGMVIILSSVFFVTGLKVALPRRPAVALARSRS